MNISLKLGCMLCLYYPHEAKSTDTITPSNILYNFTTGNREDQRVSVSFLPVSTAFSYLLEILEQQALNDSMPGITERAGGAFLFGLFMFCWGFFGLVFFLFFFFGNKLKG